MTTKGGESKAKGGERLSILITVQQRKPDKRETTEGIAILGGKSSRESETGRRIGQRERKDQQRVQSMSEWIIVKDIR